VISAAIVVRFLLWWLLAAVTVGKFQLLQRLPPAAIPAIILLITAGLVGLYFRFNPVRTWIDSLSLRTLVLVHVTRFVGVYFLILHHRGELPYAFAVPGGWGDIVVAFFALVVALAPFAPAFRLRAIRIWNVAGLVDLALVVFTAARLGLADPQSIRALTHLPLSLLPTFLVPILVATHIVIYLRLARTDAEPARS